MTEVDTRVLIETLAPLDGTANALARQLAVQAFAAECRLAGHPYWKSHADGEHEALEADYLHRVEHMALAWMAAYLMRGLRAVAPDAASAVAVAMVDMLEDGDAANEAARSWIDEYGIDAEEIVRAVRAERAGASA